MIRGWWIRGQVGSVGSLALGEVQVLRSRDDRPPLVGLELRNPAIFAVPETQSLGALHQPTCIYTQQ